MWRWYRRIADAGGDGRTHRRLARLEGMIGGGNVASAGMDAAVLSPRQHQVLAMVVAGATNRDISLRLAHSVSTVKSDVATILRTFGRDNRTQLSAYLARNPHLIDPGARSVDGSPPPVPWRNTDRSILEGAHKVHRTDADGTGLSGLRRTTARTDWTKWTYPDVLIQA